MCLITVAYRVHPDYPLIMAANRDEFFARPTEPAHEWPSHPGLIAGRDLQAGGTWMGIYGPEPGRGRVAALTNVREPLTTETTTMRSRGELVTEALLEAIPLSDLVARQVAAGARYQGFNLLAADAEGLYYGSNRHPEVQQLSPGLYGLSNATLNVPWFKVQRACSAMAAFVIEPGAPETLAGLLRDTQTAPDEELPDTGIGYKREKALSAQFIRLPEMGYGTRACTAIMVDRGGTAHMHEQNFDPDGQPGQASTWAVPNFW